MERYFCSHKGCKKEFNDDTQRQLHEAQEAHCPLCGEPSGEHVTAKTWSRLCALCVAERSETQQVYDA